ncbi:MAG: PIN domain-containing protein [Turicibacter sp.]|nr:PIN domain-containing protein [Turicibacter sp.]
MKNISVLIDTNVIIDWFGKREPFFEFAKQIMDYCFSKDIIAYVAAHSFTNLFYILRKSHSLDERRELVKKLCAELTVVSIDEDKLLLAAADDKIADFEDALQIKCAVAKNADYIVTRNIKDFANSVIPPILPSDFLAVVENERNEGLI